MFYYDFLTALVNEEKVAEYQAAKNAARMRPRAGK